MRTTQCYLCLIMHQVKRRQKKQSIKHNKQPEASITNGQYKETTEQRKARVVQDRRTYSEVTKSGKKIYVIDDNHLME